jgi:hypothetical protein
LLVLDLSDNKITKKGADTILTLVSKLPNLQVVDVTGNDQIPAASLAKIE